MNAAFHIVILGLSLTWFLGSPVNVEASKPTVDSVLAKWEAASQACKTLDAKLIVWAYDNVFDNGQPTIKYGRFYYEAPNQGRYEVRTNPAGITNDRSNISEAIIWTDKETLRIDGSRRRCDASRERNPPEDLTLTQTFFFAGNRVN